MSNVSSAVSRKSSSSASLPCWPRGTSFWRTFQESGRPRWPTRWLDRFLMRLTIGYPNSTDEKKLLRAGGAQDALEHLEPVLDTLELRELQERVSTIHVNESLVDYLMHITHTSRNHPEVALGVSTRGALTYFKACQALAMVSGRDFVIPEDIKRLAGPVLSHRILMKDRREMRGDASAEAKFLGRILNEIPVPR